MDDVIGQRFGSRTVLALRRPTADSGSGGLRALVRCECGDESWVALGDLKRGHANACRQCARPRHGVRQRQTISVRVPIRRRDTGHLPTLPATRGDCADSPRPCTFLRCKWHLGLDVKRNGSVVVDSDLDLAAMPETCALDVAAWGGATLEEIAAALDVTCERVRQIEAKALRKLGLIPEAARLASAYAEMRASRGGPPPLDEGASHGDIASLRAAIEAFVARRAGSNDTSRGGNVA